MKTLIVLLILGASCTAFGQTTGKQSKKELEKLVLSQSILIDGLNEELREAELTGTASIELIQKLQKENETLRTILKDYVKQIDQLNSDMMRVKMELDKCKNGK